MLVTIEKNIYNFICRSICTWARFYGVSLVNIFRNEKEKTLNRNFTEQ